MPTNDSKPTETKRGSNLFKHGMTNSSEYKSWQHMRDRCLNTQSDNWYRYGGRGISVCDQWKDFSVFYRDMGPKPSPKHTIERIDNGGNYTPENCRWATRMEQLRNTSRSRRITAHGITLTLSQWAEKTGIHRKTISERLDTGWTVENAVGVPCSTSPKNPTTGRFYSLGNR